MGKYVIYKIKDGGSDEFIATDLEWDSLKSKDGQPGETGEIYQFSARFRDWRGPHGIYYRSALTSSDEKLILVKEIEPEFNVGVHFKVAELGISGLAVQYLYKSTTYFENAEAIVSVPKIAQITQMSKFISTAKGVTTEDMLKCELSNEMFDENIYIDRVTLEMVDLDF